MDAKELIKWYLEETNQKAVTSANKFRIWIEELIGVALDRPLIVNQGIGGGQFFSLLHKAHRSGTYVYFFSEVQDATEELLVRGHVEFQSWLDKYSK